MKKLLYLSVLIICFCSHSIAQKNTHEIIPEIENWAPDIDLNLTVKASAWSVSVRRTVSFTIQVTNKGKDSLETAKLINTLPGGLKYISSSPSGIYRLKKQFEIIKWKINDLAPQKTLKFRLTVRAIRHMSSYQENVSKLLFQDKILMASTTIKIM